MVLEKIVENSRDKGKKGLMLLWHFINNMCEEEYKNIQYALICYRGYQFLNRYA